MICLNLFFIAFAVAFVVDVSGAVPELVRWWNARRGRPADARLRPFDCSLCMTWWSCLLYLCFAGFTWPRLAVACLAAYSARFLGSAIFIMGDVLDVFLAKIARFVDKLSENGE